MVVDDDPTTTMLCKIIFNKFSKEPGTKLFTEPETALASIKEEYSHTNAIISTILFLDINMPAMTGWEFLEMFKEFSEDIRKQFTIYLLSSSVDERDKEKAKENPLVRGFISKPLTVDRLKELFSYEQ